MNALYKRMMQRLAQWVTACTPMKSAVLLSIITLLSLLLASQLRIEHGGDNFFKANSPAFHSYQRYVQRYPAEQSDLLLVIPYKPLAASWWSDFKKFQLALEREEGVAGVLSILSASASTSSAAALPETSLAHDRLVSKDSKTTLLIVSLKKTTIERSSKLSHLIQKVRNTAQLYRLEVSIAGLPALQAELRQQVQNDIWLFTSVGILVAFVLIWLVIRSWVASLLILIVPFIAVLATFAIMSLIGISLNVLTQILVIFIVVIGASDALHLTHRLRQMDKQGLAIEERLERSVMHIVPACLLTSFTTAMGFLSLLVSQSLAVRQFGMAGFIGSLIVVAIVLLSLPLLAQSSRVKFAFGEPTLRDKDLKRVCAVWVRAIQERHTLLITSALCLLVVLSFVSIQNQTRYQVGENLSTDSDYSKSVSLLQRDYGGDSMLIVMLEPVSHSPKRGQLLKQVDRVQQHLNGGFEKPWLSIRDLLNSTDAGSLNMRLRMLPRSVQQRFWQTSGVASAILSYSLDSRYSSEAMIARVNSALAYGSFTDNWRYTVTGFSVLASASSELILGDLTKSLLLAIFIVMLLCWLIFKKLSWTLFVVVPSIFPVLAITFTLAALSEPIRYAYVLLFSVCFGLSVDSAIHVLIAYRQKLLEARRPINAMADAIYLTGVPLVIANTIVAVGFAVLMLSASPTLSMVGLVGAVAVTFGLFASLLLMPLFAVRN
jgi:predicted RND superfamily exporter protein